MLFSSLSLSSSTAPEKRYAVYWMNVYDIFPFQHHIFSTGSPLPGMSHWLPTKVPPILLQFSHHLLYKSLPDSSKWKPPLNNQIKGFLLPSSMATVLMICLYSGLVPEGEASWWLSCLTWLHTGLAQRSCSRALGSIHCSVKLLFPVLGSWEWRVLSQRVLRGEDNS